MKAILTLFACCLAWSATAQKTQTFTLDDTLRGSITPERVWWDLTFYELSVNVNPGEKSIKGQNVIHYKVLKANDVLQIDLQPPLVLEKAVQDGQELVIEKLSLIHI